MPRSAHSVLCVRRNLRPHTFSLWLWRHREKKISLEFFEAWSCFQLLIYRWRFGNYTELIVDFEMMPRKRKIYVNLFLFASEVLTKRLSIQKAYIWQGFIRYSVKFANCENKILENRILSLEILCNEHKSMLNTLLMDLPKANWKFQQKLFIYFEFF